MDLLGLSVVRAKWLMAALVRDLGMTAQGNLVQICQQQQLRGGGKDSAILFSLSIFINTLNMKHFPFLHSDG